MYSLKQKHCLVISSHLNDNKKINFEIMYSFNTPARGYHSYRRYWQLEFNQMLYLSPMEISSITKSLLDCGPRIEATLRLTHYRRSPLV